MKKVLASRRGLSLDRLGTFAAVAAARGVTAAAGGSASRQSQFSRQLKELEESFGVELIRRGRGQFALTAPGRRLLALSEQLFSALEEFDAECAGEPVELRVGGGESLIQWALLPVLPVLERGVPGTTWTFLNLRSSGVIEKLRDGRADVGVVRADAVPKGLRSLPAGGLTRALFVPEKLRPAGRDDGLDLLRNLPLAMPESDDDASDALRGAAREAGFDLVVRLRCTTLPQAAEAVRLGLAAAVLPTIARHDLATPEVRTVSLRCLESRPRKLAVAWNPQAAGTRPVLATAARALAQAIKTYMAA